MRERAQTSLYDGQFEKGAALLERALQLSPSSVAGNSARAYALLLMSRFDESLAAAQRETDEDAKREILAMTTWSLGRRAESDGYLHALESDKDRSPYTLAQIHTLRGERDLAFDELERAYRQREVALISVRLDPLLRRLRDDSRYADLLKKMKLSE
jgi:tetratricopeptide (TPR) repeat protein